MTDIRVNSEDLARTAAQLRVGAAEIDSHLNAMRTQVQSLVNGGWQGAAAAAFDGLYQQWGTSAVRLREALDGISRLLANASADYAITEQRIIDSMRH